MTEPPNPSVKGTSCGRAASRPLRRTLGLNMVKLILWYIALSIAMLIFKSQGDISRAGNGGDLIANAMALVLAQPWFSYTIAAATDQDLVTFQNLLHPVLANIALMLVVGAALKHAKARREAK
jgi:uncharacterized membrane protein